MKGGLHRLIEVNLLKDLGRPFYMAIRRAQRAGYTFKFCRERDGRVTVRPSDGIINGEPNKGCMMRTVYIRWGRQRGYKTWQTLRWGKPPFNRTLRVPDRWREIYEQFGK
jgi:hypothetical protein